MSSYPAVLRSLPLRLLGVVTLIALVAAFVIAPLGADAKPPARTTNGLLTVPITGTAVDSTTGATYDAFVGTFTAQQFKTSGGQLQVLGTLTGTVFDALGNTIGTVNQQLTLPGGVDQATCDILILTLGPLDLDLLGLVVHLDQVHLEITAEAGPGNLLGNLLCSVAGLLDGGLSLNIVADLLNVIVKVLQDLGLA